MWIPLQIGPVCTEPNSDACDCEVPPVEPVRFFSSCEILPVELVQLLHRLDPSMLPSSASQQSAGRWHYYHDQHHHNYMPHRNCMPHPAATAAVVAFVAASGSTIRRGSSCSFCSGGERFWVRSLALGLQRGWWLVSIIVVFNQISKSFFVPIPTHSLPVKTSARLFIPTYSYT